MTNPPTTLAELDAALAKAKAAGITPIVQFNGGATGGLAFPLQNLMAAYGPAGPINDWIFDKPNATIDTPTNRQAAQHLVRAGEIQVGDAREDGEDDVEGLGHDRSPRLDD